MSVLSVTRYSMVGEILGLPEWWCAASVVIGLLIFVFLLYAYYKGRRMMKENERTTGIRNIRCSECGIHLKDRSATCPGCGAGFEGDSYVCPACGSTVDRDEKSCPSCGKALRNVRSRPEGKKRSWRDPDLAKLRSRRKGTALQECPACGALYEPGSSCPVCNRGW
jgi:rubrerythrin